MMQASALELDALNEIANVGMSRAATQLSALLDDAIEVTLPDVRILPINELIQTLAVNNSDKVSTVSQSLQGYINGTALLMFHDEESRALVNALIGSVPTLAGIDMRDYEHEAMMEIGNIIISSAIAVMADMLGGEIQLSVPVFTEETVGSMFDRHTDDELASEYHVIVMESTMTAAQRNVKGTLMIMLKVGSVKGLLEKLNEYLLSHGMLI